MPSIKPPAKVKTNAFYAQSGGVTAVINATACGVIETAAKHRSRIGKVFAGRNGIIGALNEELLDTSRESAGAIAGLRTTPSGAFGSCRYKLSSIEADASEYHRLIDVFRAHDIGYFFYNGGGDSQDTAHKVSQLGAALNYPITCIGIPKTVDNDLPYTDTCSPTCESGFKCLIARRQDKNTNTLSHQLPNTFCPLPVNLQNYVNAFTQL